MNEQPGKMWFGYLTKLFAGAMFVCISIEAQTRCPQDSRLNAVATQFTVRAGSVQMPPGAFLLVKKNGHRGALRLTSIDSQSAVYESVYERSDTGPGLSGNVDKRSGTLNLRPVKGPGRGVYMYKPGPYKAHIGKWSFPFDEQGLMALSDQSFWTGVGEHGFEFAPTSACNLSEIDFDDKRLQWFKRVRYDTDRPPINLLLSDLPK
jgi:hypothetical protein